MPNKLIICAALTGVVPTKAQNPHLPLTPREIAAEAKKVAALGASIVHVHARDAEGRPSWKKEIYREIIERIRESCPELIITVSTSGRRTKDLGERLEVLELEGSAKPDLASLTLGSVNLGREYSLTPAKSIIRLLETMQGRGIRPELEIFGSGMADYARYLFEKGHLSGRYYANLILGSLGSIPATPKHLVNLAAEVPEGIVWGATGVGQSAFAMQSLAIVLGGHVRAGLEDSLYMDPDKVELATNEKLVLRVRRVAEAVGRETASPKEVRELLGL